MSFFASPRFAVVFVALASLTPLLQAQDDPLKGFAPAYAALMKDAVRSFSQRDFPTAVALVEKAELPCR
jgi:hypothetical protein